MEREAFKLFASLEERHWWFIGRRGLYVPLLRSVLEREGAWPARTPLSVADVGCGVGGFLQPLANFGPVLGLELDEEALAWCRRRGFTRLAAAYSDRAPLPDASHDLLCLWDVIEHTPDDVAVLREMRRCLRPGGHLALSVPAYPWLYANNDRVAHHHRRYTRRDLLAKLRAAGLQPCKATYVNVALSLAIIPAVLLLKLKERLRPHYDARTNNLSFGVPRPVNAALAAIFASERHLLRHVDAPFGHSLFAVARRPREDAPCPAG